MTCGRNRSRRSTSVTLQASASRPSITTPRSWSGCGRPAFDAVGPADVAAAEPKPAGQHTVVVERQSARLQQRVHLGGQRQGMGLAVVVDVVGQRDQRLDIRARDGLAAPDAAGDEPCPARLGSAAAAVATSRAVVATVVRIASDHAAASVGVGV